MDCYSKFDTLLPITHHLEMDVWDPFGPALVKAVSNLILLHVLHNIKENYWPLLFIFLKFFFFLNWKNKGNRENIWFLLFLKNTKVIKKN